MVVCDLGPREIVFKMHPTPKGWIQHPVSLSLWERMGGDATKQGGEKLLRVKTQPRALPIAGIRELKSEAGAGLLGHEHKAEAQDCPVCECALGRLGGGSTMISAGSSLRSGAQTTPENTLLTPFLPRVFSKGVFGPSSHCTPNTDYAWNKQEIDMNINTQQMNPQRIRGDPRTGSG